jgi:hypothetical protein
MVPRTRRRALLPLIAGAVACLVATPFAGADFGKDEKKFDNQSYPAPFRAKVQQAITKAANWLLFHQRDDGSWAAPTEAGYPMGPSALATLSLVKAGVPVGHPKVERAFQYLKKQPLNKTYEVGILLMLLDAKYDPVPDPFAKEEVDNYGNRVVPEPCADKITKDDLAWMKQGVDFLVKTQESGHWRYPTPGSYDLSNTQYALLGLKAASRCGLKIPNQVWLDSLSFLLRLQATTGTLVDVRANEVRGDYRIEWTEKAVARGFPYVAEAKRAPSTGSMTTAGAAGLMICQSELWKSRKFGAEQRAETRIAVRDALAWMQENLDVSGNPRGSPVWHYYFLYGLERMGILAHTRFLGKTDWYKEGADYLLYEQEPDGAWDAGQTVNTCFGLLFLKRASFRVSNPVITPDVEAAMDGRDVPTPTPPPPAPTDPAPAMSDGGGR